MMASNAAYDLSDPPDPPASITPTLSTRLRITAASQIPILPVDWAWHKRIPAGAITLVPGREGIGKSLFLAWLIAAITRGTLPGIHYGTPRGVFYAATEDSWSHTIAPRLHAAGADLDRVYRVEVERDGLIDSLCLPRDCPALAPEMQARDVVLLAADPLLSLIDSRLNVNHGQPLRVALEPLARLAADTGCAVVGLAHFNKSASTDSLILVTGNGAFAQVSRAVLAAARDNRADDGSCVMTQVKNNLGPTDLPSLRYLVESVQLATEHGPAEVGRLVFTGETDRSVHDILADNGRDTDQRAERDEAAEWLVAYLHSQGGQAERTQLLQAAHAAGFTVSTLKRACKKARVTAAREGFASGSVWRLTADHPQSPGSSFSSHSAHSAHLPEREPNEPNEVRMAATKINGRSVSHNGAVIR